MPATTTPPGAAGLPVRWKRIAISVFLGFHLVIFMSWSMPLNTLLVGALNQKVTRYMQWSGLFQGWDMFSPNPATDNVYVDAVVTLRDGSTRTFSFPRMHDLGLWDRYVKERYRKFANDRLRLDMNSGMWPDAARYAARQFENAVNPPVNVRLFRHWWFTPPPPGAPAPPDEKWAKYMFFNYNVQPGDLA